MTTETNAERLEIAKDLLEWVEIYSTENSFDALKHTLRELTDGDHINWLIQQAEQLNDIENRSVLNSLKECNEENARLREALLALSQGKFDCCEDECANFALKALAGNPDGQR